MTDELTDALKYQVVLLGPDRNARLKQFTVEFRQRVSDLGLEADQHTEVLVRLPAGDRAQTGVNAVIWCGSRDGSSNAEIQTLDRLIQAGVSIFPAVESLSEYSEMVPDILRPVNGIAWDNCHQLITSVLETLGLLRTGKRVFISYRRKESQAVADQLFEQLQHRGYNAFLDTASIEPGRMVQDHLKSQLLNMDVVVLLHSKQAMASSWVMEEVLDAQRRGTEVFDVLWPDANPAPELSLAIAERLKSTDFSNPNDPDPATHKLEAAFLSDFVVRIERARIRSVRTRRDRLLRQLAEDADLAQKRFRYFATGHNTITSIPFAGFGPLGDKEVASMAIVSHGTPDALELQKGQQVTLGIDGISRPASIVYDEFGLLEEQTKHLTWLNSLAASTNVKFLPLSRHLRWLTGVSS